MLTNILRQLKRLPNIDVIIHQNILTEFELFIIGLRKLFLYL